MGVYIKGMEMPKDGYIDVRIFPDGIASKATGEKPYYEEFRVVEIKAPHGRLIDADEIKPNLYDPRLEAINNGKATYYANMEQIHNAPTVIDTEGNDED